MPYMQDIEKLVLVTRSLVTAEGTHRQNRVEKEKEKKNHPAKC